ncbi:MAG: transglycosylase family protein [Streptosporangiales bacterium]|nr:transglycosylase family protein [Streptosporangiales bacterium]
MSSSATHARHSLARRIPAVAAPALGIAATAFAVVGTPATSMAATHAPAAHHAAAARTTRVASVTRKVATAAKQASKQASAPTSYSVQSGDTLSSIARHFYKESSFWTAVYQANKSTIHYADSITPGQSLTIPAKPSSAPAAPSSLSAPAPQPVEQQSAPVEQSAPTQSADTASSDTSTSGDSSFQQCVISHESGGNSQVTNSSGHYGLYQFSPSTWAEYGGNPSDFGNASASEQNQVFDNAMAQGGQSNWSAYDGC